MWLIGCRGWSAGDLCIGKIGWDLYSGTGQTHTHRDSHTHRETHYTTNRCICSYICEAQKQTVVGNQSFVPHLIPATVVHVKLLKGHHSASLSTIHRSSAVTHCPTCSTCKHQRARAHPHWLICTCSHWRTCSKPQVMHGKIYMHRTTFHQEVAIKKPHGVNNEWLHILLLGLGLKALKQRHCSHCSSSAAG